MPQATLKVLFLTPTDMVNGSFLNHQNPNEQIQRFILLDRNRAQNPQSVDFQVKEKASNFFLSLGGEHFDFAL